MIFQSFGCNRARLGYVLANRTAEILGGDPHVLMHLGRGIAFRQKIFSGVLSFTEPLDQQEGSVVSPGQLTRPRLKMILRQFRRVMGIGGDASRLYWLFVLHTDKGRTEVHCLGVQVDLLTGRSHSIYVHPRDAKRLRLWQSAVNSKFEFTDPDSGAARLEAKINPRACDFSIKTKILEQVKAHFRRRDDAGPSEVIEFLRQKNYAVLVEDQSGRPRTRLAVRHSGKVIPLNGVYFTRNFNLRTLRDWVRPVLGSLVSRLKERLERLKKLNAERYRVPRVLPGAEHRRAVVPESLVHTSARKFSFRYRKKAMSIPVPPSPLERLFSTSPLRYRAEIVQPRAANPLPEPKDDAPRIKPLAPAPKQTKRKKVKISEPPTME